MADEVLLSMRAVRPKRATEDMDSIKESKKFGNRRAFDVLMQAQYYRDQMTRFLKDRERNKRYTYGDQWGDLIVYYDSKKMQDVQMTEEQYIKEQGSVPLKNNLIRRLVKNVLGVYRGQSKEPVCTARDRDEQKLGETMSTLLQYNRQTNRASLMEARGMEEFMISGFVVQRKSYGWRNGRLDCWTDNVQPNNFIIDNNMRDFRGWDCSFVGEIHDVPFGNLCEQHAHTPEDFNRLKNIYALAADRRNIASMAEQFGYSRKGNFDLLMTSDPTLCRVIEVWRKEQKPRYRCHDYNTGDVFKCEVEDYYALVESVNQSRLQRGMAAGMDVEDIPLIHAEWFIDDYWYYYYLTPFGDILEEGETPYEHGSHPYVFMAYPFIDGEIHSFVADVIDQQRYTNRLITLYDWIMRSSAKGVLLMPEQALEGSSMSIEEIADEWTRFNGVILYKAKPGIEVPQQISSNSTNIGINELLQIQLKFFEDISGVHGALQGRAGVSGTSGKLYEQQQQNATTSLLDMLDTYSMFVVDGAYKDVKNMQQYYSDKKCVSIAGKTAVYDKDLLQDVEFDLSITESTSSQAYRQYANEFLMQIWEAGQISLEQLLTVGQFPFGDELLQSIKSQKEQLEQGQVPDGMSPELQQQVAASANQAGVQQLYGALRDAA